MTFGIRALRTFVPLAVLAAAFLAGEVHGQDTGGNKSQAPSGAAGQRSMMAERQQMMAQAQAAEKRLDELVAKMNASRGSDKIEDIAAVVNELVAQHKRMGPGMMQRMQTERQPQNDGAKPRGSGEPAVDHQEHHPPAK
jgi:hypothetical protein